MRRAGAAAALVTLSACGLFADPGSYSADAGSDAAEQQPDATLEDSGDAATRDAPSDAVSDAVSDANEGAAIMDAEPCPGEAGPIAVRVGAFCIDRTEVTRGQYHRFVEAGVDAKAQPASCAWNATFVPVGGPLAPDLPVTYIDWCDAYAYCAWAGKRLCGAIGGGANDPADYANAARSEWFHVCSHDNDGQHAYPYGPTYDNGLLCNDANRDAGSVTAAGSLPGCQGGFPGVFDMSGNVWEWEDSCEAGAAEAGTDDACRLRGGPFNLGVANTRCNVDHANARTFATANVGFRCCSP